jgi:2-(1,2-epoxy-1,2-dihydrophenyl)acetyl-CoA isomerase
MAYTKIGFTPDGGSTWFLTRIVGARRALELTLLNRVLGAKEAFDLGIVTHVVPDDRVDAEAEALAAALAAGPTRAFRGAKRLFLAGASESLETQLERETQEIAASGRTADGREGVAAFAAKRAPRFRGE